MNATTDRKVSRLSALRDKIAGDGGFTLLEVLAVMVIVGLLAAITIPQISKWREKAYVTAMKTDARNVANAVEANFVDDQVYAAPAAGDVTLNTGNLLNDFATNGVSEFSFNITSPDKAPGVTVNYDSDAVGSPLTTD